MSPIHPNRLEKEINRLHKFFEDWFMGKIDGTDAKFATFEQVLGDSFCLINPKGVMTRRSDLVDALRAAYGCRRDHTVFTIQCRNVQVLSEHIGTTVLCCYEEWQRVGEIETARLASAWFQDNGHDRPLVWLHVHETWLPGRGPPSELDMWQPPPPLSPSATE